MECVGKAEVVEEVNFCHFLGYESLIKAPRRGLTVYGGQLLLTFDEPYDMDQVSRCGSVKSFKIASGEKERGETRE